MARERLYAVTCARCSREEHVTEEAPRTFEAHLGDREVVYDDLCTECHTTLGGLLDEAGKLLKVSPKRAKATRPAPPALSGEIQG